MVGLPEPIEAAVNLPWHLTKGIAHFSLWPVRAIMNTSYMPKTPPPKEGESVYDITQPMFDIAAMVYYYTELRSSTNHLLEKYAKKFNLSTKEIEDIRNAIVLTEKKLDALKQLDQADASSSNVAAEYQESLTQLEHIKTRHGLSSGDIEVFTTYFDILKEPKDATSIKRDLMLYRSFISPTFRAFLGGSDFNEDTIIAMVDRDPKMYVSTIDDDFANKSIAIHKGLGSELVYAIFVSPENKRVTVSFRGSVNIQDWITNTKFFGKMTDLKLPGFTSEKDLVRDERKSYGRVHIGFYDYLFGKTKKGASGSNISKSEEIMGHLTDLFENKCKGFSLFVTGHSLGGAMSTLFATRAATFGKFGKVTNVSFASPYCGDQGFRDHFYDLEQKGLIRHIRISNEEDVVPLVLPVAPNLPFIGTNKSGVPLEMYKHTGMNFRMYRSSQPFFPNCRFFYPKMGSLPNEVQNAVLNNLGLGLSFGLVGKHLCLEYSKRLEDCKDELKKISVEDLYADTSITGWSNALM